ncbi:protein-methionine-sulfoxide reductase catalytic subunit MsrP [Paracoccaceae bacterium]|nr:protein-methionine-sulfoxide reductase catalytic subunit MsrP [Paracoccaceae bacterium]
MGKLVNIIGSYILEILKYSDVTPHNIYLNRRKFVEALGLTSLAVVATPTTAKLGYSTSAKPNTIDEITNYNNFYEFGTSKTDPAKYAHSLTTDPWEITFEGVSQNKKKFYLPEILRGKAIQERIYRLRCVEGWSMVIPWIGFPLRDLINELEIDNNAKFVAFETVYRPTEMRGQKRTTLDWPYREGLTIEEALHPLTFIATGLYGKELPNQNGAPFRLVVPWKYGFKSIKSITKISFMKEQPYTTWSSESPREYGFYSNVNPNVDHPRWSQATERVIGEGLFGERRKTELFNGYIEEVGDLYKGMDLKKYY